MSFLQKHIGLYTDYYELTMAQGYFLAGKEKVSATFDYFFRDIPFKGGYVIFAGLADVLSALQSLRYEKDDLDYLRSLGFHEAFLNYLSTFRFQGNIRSVREGEVVFPLEPVVRVSGNIIETQLIETLLLNLLNFESLIATKASRIRLVSGKRPFIDFGLRRAQAMGSIHATRAAIIGGAESTSNVYAAYCFDLNISGTQAHSWIQTFEDELTAFRKFAEYYPNNCILLVDTYDTLRSGVPHAITVAKELEQRGYRLKAIRLDSGDLAYLSKKARQMLDDAGLSYVKIIASNQLDEYVIRSLTEQQAPIDAFGIGTRLITGQETASLDGVYKMSVCDGKMSLKISDNYTKITLPGIKKIVRYINEENIFYADGILLEEEEENRADMIYHPYYPHQKSSVRNYKAELLLQLVMEKGHVYAIETHPHRIAEYAQQRLAQLAPEHKRFEYPHTYKVGISKQLRTLRDQLLQQV